jgi:guanylate kinase
MLLVIAGPSGVGKGTVIKKVLEKLPDSVLSISSTTRMPRKGEVDGVDYNFLSEKVFDERISNNEFLEWANVHNHKYGTELRAVKGLLNHDKIVILEIDVQGAFQVKINFSDSVHIFIAPPSLDVLEKRLRGRKTEAESVIKSRLQIAKLEIDKQSEFDNVVVNEEIDNTANQIIEIIQKNCSKFNLRRKSE